MPFFKFVNATGSGIVSGITRNRIVVTDSNLCYFILFCSDICADIIAEILTDCAAPVYC